MEQESLAKPNVINGDDIESVSIDGAPKHVNRVDVTLKNGEILTFEPRIEMWNKGINCFMEEKKAFTIKDTRSNKALKSDRATSSQCEHCDPYWEAGQDCGECGKSSPAT